MIRGATRCSVDTHLGTFVALVEGRCGARAKSKAHLQATGCPATAPAVRPTPLLTSFLSCLTAFDTLLRPVRRQSSSCPTLRVRLLESSP